MKLLLDQNLSFKLCGRLADLLPGSTQVRLVGLAEADDRTVWDHAGVHGFVLVSHDADFAEPAALLGPPPHVVWLRCGNQPLPLSRRYCANTPTRSRFSVEDPGAACLEIY